MWKSENTGQDEMERGNGKKLGSRGVYMRVKRLRFDNDGDDKDVAPSLLRVRIGDGKSMDVSGSMRDEKGSLSHNIPDTPSLTELGQQPCTLHFRLLNKAGDFISSEQETQSARRTTVSSPTPVLSIERVWDLRGCVVMDCTAGGSSQTDTGAPEKKESGDPVGGAVALEDSNVWSLYVLDSRHVDDNESEQKKEKVEMEMKEEEEEEDEFGFDDLVVTKPNDSDEEENDVAIHNDNKAFVYGSKFVSHRIKRKRDQDEIVPDFILSMGMQPHDGEVCNHDTSPEDAALLYEMLRDHGQTCFLLEEDNGCEPELYLYPDHRKDDEYDSNAADFSGNEYPEEPSENNSSFVDSEYTDYDDERHYKRRQGDLWYEESYREGSLSSGWNSCDDNY
ncbi:uncharacterized protein TM35_000082550 [Trypanosoma theileri]|uniref:Transcription factor Iwr1 domain-containing protein n=1 Tax=Trypanosoma theileri TaxID=67003 RepID=A0A1X0P0I9_9TRYP|nr:uncharacterized protein TM35_000082550 [Trypanosoma theileri]ORC90457.1 hypothetical protein TM35_000082550 [Trypanosoma theileri]